MGIQASIKVADIPEGFKVEFDHEEYRDDEGRVDGVNSWATLTAPDGEEHTFNTSGDLAWLWVDVNHWGSNRAVYLPFLQKHSIPFIEG